MSDDAFRLEKTTLGPAWDALAAASSSGTLYARSAYLEALPGPFSVYLCKRNNETRGGLLVTESPDRTRAVLHPLVVYAGVLLPKPAHRQNLAQITSERFAVCRTVAADLPTLYESVELALSPAVEDIRPFLWHNYGRDDAPRYRADLRYTAWVDIGDLGAAQSPEDTGLFARCSAARRQEVRYARKKGVGTEETALPEEFVRYYAMTMARQDIVVPETELAAMRNLLEALLDNGLARMFASRTARGEIGAMAVMGLDDRRSGNGPLAACYLFGAGDPALRDSHCGSAVLWDAFTALSRDGVQCVDLEGVNSPRRGWFKLSFGARMERYFELTLGPAC